MMVLDCDWEIRIMHDGTKALMKESGLGGMVVASYEESELERLGILGSGFGFNRLGSMRLFTVFLGGKKDSTMLYEVTVNKNPSPATQTAKADIHPELWKVAGPVLANEFNERLRKNKQKASAWRKGHVPLGESFGKEAVVLAWALEELAPSDIDTARRVVANWQSLSPEERWWLYLMANAKFGSWPDGKGKGWRKAIGVALSDFGQDDGQARDLLLPRLANQQQA